MNIKVRIVKRSKKLNRIVVFCLAGSFLLLFHEIKGISGSPTVILTLFFTVFIIVLMSRLLILDKLSLPAGYVEFSEQSIFVHDGTDIYVGNWDLIGMDNIVYKGDAINLFCCSVGNRSTLKIKGIGEKELIFQLHFPSRAHYVSILSFINRLKLIKEYEALLIKYPDMRKYLYLLDKKKVFSKKNSETNNLPPSENLSASDVLLLNRYCFLLLTEAFESFYKD
jgi:hypothetical protein